MFLKTYSIESVLVGIAKVKEKTFWETLWDVIVALSSLNYVNLTIHFNIPH